MLSAGIETILETIHISDTPGIRQGRDTCQDVRGHPRETNYVDTLIVPNKPTPNCPVLTLEIAQLIPDTLYRIFLKLPKTIV